MVRRQRSLNSTYTRFPYTLLFRVIALASQAVVVDAQLRAPRVAEFGARFQEHALAARVHQVALDRIDRDRLAVAVVVQAFLRIRHAADEIERALEIGRAHV